VCLRVGLATKISGYSPNHSRYACQRDYEITVTENGEEVLAAIGKQRPDLILMDIQLPIILGYTATSDPALRSIPIIVVTFSVEAF